MSDRARPFRHPRASTGRAVGGLVAVAAVAVVAEALAEPRRLRVRRAELRLVGWPQRLDGLRVVLLGDLHAGAPGVSLAAVLRLVTRVRSLCPELVLLAGDSMADVYGGRHLDPSDVAAALSGLAVGAPVVGVLGNHDWYAGGNRVRSALESAGLRTLENEAEPVTVRGGPLWVAGVADLWERHPSVDAALAGVPHGEPVLMLTHNPDAVVDVPPPPRVALTLAGHTHGGQVALFGRPLHRISPSTGNRWVAGSYIAGGRPLYVTSGVGTSLLPIRFGVVPEIAMLTLRGLALDQGEC